MASFLGSTDLAAIDLGVFKVLLEALTLGFLGPKFELLCLLEPCLYQTLSHDNANLASLSVGAELEGHWKRNRLGCSRKNSVYGKALAFWPRINF